MGEVNKKYNRRISRPCPVCDGRVVVAQRNGLWWVRCEEDAHHIPQKFFGYANAAVNAWNVKANKQTHRDMLRSMSDEDLSELLTDDMCELLCGAPLVCVGDCKKKMLEWLKQEANEKESAGA